MGLDIIYSSGEQKYKWPLSMKEFECFNILVKKGLGELIEPLLGVTDFGKNTSVDKRSLIKAINELLDKIENESEMLPVFYDAQIEIPRGSGKYSKGGYGIGGLSINNERYDLESGFDECFIRKKWSDQDGKIHIGEPIDIRHLSEIKTDNDHIFGDVKIVKKKMTSKGLKQKLKNLKEFVEKCDGGKIYKLLG